MPVRGLHHITIVAADLAETVRFYENLLDFRMSERPEGMSKAGGWLLDADGQPIVHLLTFDPARHGAAERRAMPTGSIDHVALVCEDFADTIRRCQEFGVAHKVNDREYAGLRQVFVTDPNNVVLELNFSGD